MGVFISCEQGGHLVPPALNSLLGARRQGDLASSFSTGASSAWAAQRLSKLLKVPLVRNQFSPDLIDVRRSLHHRELLGSKTRQFDKQDRQTLIDLIYDPYRSRVRKMITGMLTTHSYVVHLSIQTFRLRCKKGKLRRTDVGLLYDPSRDDEVDFCLDWIDEMYDDAPMLKVRRNYPGRGTNDSLTKAMRSEFAGSAYLGIEVWLNEAWSQRDVSLRTEALHGMAWALQSVTESAATDAA